MILYFGPLTIFERGSLVIVYVCLSVKDLSNRSNDFGDFGEIFKKGKKHSFKNTVRALFRKINFLGLQGSKRGILGHVLNYAYELDNRSDNFLDMK